MMAVRLAVGIVTVVEIGKVDGVGPDPSDRFVGELKDLHTFPDVMRIHWKVLELNCGIALKPVANYGMCVGIVGAPHHQRLTVRRGADFSVVNDQLSCLEDISWKAKHRFDVVLTAVDGDVRIRSRTQVTF